MRQHLSGKYVQKMSPRHFPLAIALFDPAGKMINVESKNPQGHKNDGTILEIKRETENYVFSDILKNQFCLSSEIFGSVKTKYVRTDRELLFLSDMKPIRIACGKPADYTTGARELMNVF